MKQEFWKKDWFLALVITLSFGIAALWGSSFLESLERIAYDFGVKMTNRNAGAIEKIAIIAIDDTSIEKIGRWPWPRSVLAAMIEQLAQARTKLIALQIFLSETQADPGLAYIRKLNAFLASSRLPRVAPHEARQLAALLRQGEQELNADQKLAQTIPAAKNVFMPMFFRIGIPLGKPDAPLPDFVQRNHLTKIITPGDNPSLPPPTYSALYPLPIFGNATAGIGHLNLIPDVDGGIRSEPLVLEYYGEYYPSLALLIAAKSLNLGPRNITVRLGDISP